MDQEFRIEVAQLTDTGRKRRRNEDFVGYYAPDDPAELVRLGRLYLVADGVGGAASGQIASEYAVRKVLHEYYNEEVSAQDLGEHLLQAIETTNADIHERNERHPEERAMATTIVAALVIGDKLVVANLGDSRAYLVRDDTIRQITHDHSLVQQLVDEGSIAPEEAKDHPRRNVVMRSLGIDARVRVDLFDGQVRPGDVLVLCSDGLTRHVDDKEIAETVLKYPPDKAVRHLVDLANVRGGKDNISVSVMRIGEPVPAAALAEAVESPLPPDWEQITTDHARRKALRPKRPVSPLVLAAAAGAGLIVLGVAAALWMLSQPAGVPTPSVVPLPITTTLPAVIEAPAPTDTLPPPPPTVTTAPTATLQPTTAIPTPMPVAISPDNAAQVVEWHTLSGHTSEVQSVAFSPDGTILASGALDGTVQLWRVSDGELRRTLEGHTSGVWSVAFSPDGETLASGSGDGTARLWRVSDGELWRTLEGHTQPVYSVAFSPDGETLALGSQGEVRLWQVADNTPLTLSGPTGDVYSVAFSLDGAMLASGSQGEVWLWRVDEWSLLRTFTGHAGYVYSVAFPDGATLASGSFDNTVQLWEISTGSLLRMFTGHTGYVYSVAFSPDGAMLASGSSDGTVRLWRVSDETLLHTLSEHTQPVHSVAFSPDGTTLASGSWDDTVRLWRVRVE